MKTLRGKSPDLIHFRPHSEHMSFGLLLVCTCNSPSLSLFNYFIYFRQVDVRVVQGQRFVIKKIRRSESQFHSSQLNPQTRKYPGEKYKSITSPTKLWVKQYNLPLKKIIDITKKMLMQYPLLKSGEKEMLKSEKKNIIRF